MKVERERDLDGLVITAETPEESEELVSLWCNKGYMAAFERKEDRLCELTIASKPIDTGELTGEERIAIWNQYKKEHPNPELAEGGDFAYINMLLKAARAKFKRIGEELGKERKSGD